MSTSYCDYHPNREAEVMCESCNRSICSQDKETYIASSGTKGAVGGQSAGIYCPSCYYDLAQELGEGPFTKELATGISIVLIVLFVGGFITLYATVLQGANQVIMFFFIFFIMVGIGMIWLVYYLTQNINKETIDIDEAEKAYLRLQSTRQDKK